MSKKLLTDIAASLQMFEARSLNLPPDITLEQFSDIGRFLKQCSDASQLWLQDWKAQGERILGRDAVAMVCQQLVLEIEVARSLPPPSERIESLSVEHHFIAGWMCEDIEDAKMWLATAVEAKLDANQLRLSIKAGEVRRASPQAAGARVGLANIGAVMYEWTQFRRRVDVQKYTPDVCAEIDEMFSPVVAEINEWIGQIRNRTALLKK